MALVYSIYLLVFHFVLTMAWDPDAGLVPSLTKLPGVIVTASSSVSSVNQTLDNNDNTHWLSGFCLPSGYINRQSINIIRGACGPSMNLCSSSQSDASELQEATDGSFYHVADIPIADGADGTRKASLVISFPSPTNVTLISLWGVYHASTTVSLVDKHGASTQIKVAGPSDNHTEIRLKTDVLFKVSKIHIESSATFSIKEIAAMGYKGCFEQVTIDLGTKRVIGSVRTRHWAGYGNALSLALKLSNDTSSWTEVASLNPDALHAVVTRIATQKAQYIALEYQVVLKNYFKVYCWEVDAWDEYGEWGAPIVPKPQSNSLRDLLGVNGIWGWGYKSYSSNLQPTQGPGLYNAVASHARNYHNLEWDVSDPDNSPGFARMNQCNCTNAMNWLNWDWEYSAWANKNMTIDASIQFTNKRFEKQKWDHPEASSYNYGREFAAHFGPRHGNGLITAMEVGNEPWDYDAAFYTQVLKGMSSGVRSVDGIIQVLPGAFQAHNKHDTGNYIGTRLLQDISVYVSAINFHTYSYHVNESGIRVATYPEHVDSSFNSMRNIIRWRDTNMPSKSVWVTEWGWDGSGGGEDCTFSECVTEEAQAVYGIRGLLILSRSNVERVTWFFYANTECNHLYCRSGLTTTKNHNFAKKAVFHAFESILRILGDKCFLGILKEDSDAYVYAYGADCSFRSTMNNSTELLMRSSHLVAWKPVDVGNPISNFVTLNLPTGIHVVPKKSWKFTGSYPPAEQTTAYKMCGSDLIISLSAHPTVVEMERLHVNSNEVLG